MIQKIWDSWAGPWIIALFFILLCGLVDGCTLTTTQGGVPSVEQFQVDAPPGHKIYKCFKIAGGPPVGGAFVFIILPDTATGPIFGDNCAIINQFSQGTQIR